MRSKVLLTLFVFAPALLHAQTQAAATANTTANATIKSATHVHAESQTNANAEVQGKSPQARIDAAMQAAAKAKVPTSLLESKVEEGQAKRVPQERIAAAVEARAKALIDAKQTFNRADIETTSTGELAVAADAIQAGVKKDVLIEAYENTPPGRRVVAVAVLTDLVRLGASSDQAFARVNSAVTSSVALANLQAQVASQLRLGGLSSTLDASGIVRIR
jgi:hypothetical protein